jgi:hypothetical protein
METTILRSQVLQDMDRGERFDLVFVTCDRKRGTGGDLVTCMQWQKINGDPVQTGTPGVKRRKEIGTGFVKRNPHHQVNKTINIFNPASRKIHPISIHIRLIQYYNNKRVLNG